MPNGLGSSFLSEVSESGSAGSRVGVGRGTQ